MSALAISSGVAGRPSFGGAISAANAVATSRPASGMPKRQLLNIDVTHLAVCGHGPALDRIEVEILSRCILCHPLGARGLHAAFFIGRSAHQHGGAAIP